MSSKLTVLVATCDQYQPLWKNFTKCYKKYLPYNLETLFVGETICHPEYLTFIPGKEKWGKRVRESLAYVKTPYVLFLLDDYFLSFDYGLDRLCKYVRDMESYGMNRLQISRSSYQTYMGTNDQYLKFDPKSEYQHSLQPSIWRKDWIEQTCPDEFTPWDFEVKNSRNNIGLDTSTYIDPSINFPVYFNAVRKGFVKSEGWNQFKLREGLEEF